METPDERIDPPGTGTPLEVLRGFVDYHRDTLMRKASGLDTAALRTRHAPSTMTLIGLVGHLAYVEDYWLRYLLLGDDPIEPFTSAPWEEDDDWEWTWANAVEPAEVFALYEQTRTRADAALERVIAGSADPLAHQAARPRRSMGQVNLAWILAHLIEEYARHNGHADLIRESLDGATGE